MPKNSAGVCRSGVYCDSNSLVKAGFICTDVTAEGSYYTSDLWIIEWLVTIPPQP